MELICAVKVPGNAPGKRIGLVKFYETGYYPSNLDSIAFTDEQAEQAVLEFNAERGVSPEVSESALEGSMFGWHAPCADPAIEFFKQRSMEE